MRLFVPTVLRRRVYDRSHRDSYKTLLTCGLLKVATFMVEDLHLPIPTETMRMLHARRKHHRRVSWCTFLYVFHRSNAVVTVPAQETRKAKPTLTRDMFRQTEAAMRYLASPGFWTDDLQMALLVSTFV